MVLYTYNTVIDRCLSRFLRRDLTLSVEPSTTSNTSSDAPSAAEGLDRDDQGSAGRAGAESDVVLKKSKTTRYSAQSDIRNPIRLFGDMCSDAWEGRELAWRLFLRNIRGMYRQTLLGLFWAFLPPIANTAIWVFLSRQGVFNTGDMEVPMPLFILTGMILWQAFSDGLLMPLDILNKNKNMLGKLRFSREALLMVGLGEIFFDLLIRSVLLVIACAWFGVAPGIMWFGAIASVTMMVVLAASIGVLLMPIGSLYLDVNRFLGMAMPFCMFLTPVIYPPLTTFPGSLLSWLNPASPFLVLARDLLLMGQSDAWMPALIWMLITFPLVIFALIVFRISMPVLIERMNA